ncbi:MAG: Sulfoxide reductase heme-binding subunit YedZ [Candidatus Izimaplasma bacterium HR2]|nr:MAG: Sulfoxide reductase heme-binding subunit YedZ [Candidatus Izimaplasma bacterium HR2]
MIVVIFVALLTLLAVYKGKWVRNQNLKLYIGATVLAIIAFLLEDKVKIFEPFVQGFLGLSFFYIVMMTGALKKKSKLRIKFAGIRREYSILGFIFITPHALKYFVEYLNGEIALEWWGVATYLVMLPLFITSFMVIRKKMSRNAWVYLQKLAYVSYITLFIHLILNASNTPNLVVYLLLFVPYISMKIYREILEYTSKKKVLETT